MFKGLGALFGAKPEPEPDGPPPPTALTDEAVEAWLTGNFDLTDWVYIGFAPAAVSLASRVTPAPKFRIGWRLENFRTGPDQSGRPMRSFLAEFDIDSVERRAKPVSITSFRENGLKPGSPEPVEDEPSFAIDGEPTIFFEHVRDLCAELASGRREVPVSRLRKDMEAWAAAFVTPGEDIFAHFDDAAATFVRKGSVKRSGGGYLLTVRAELFRPFEGRRSQLEHVELDGRGHRYRLIEFQAFGEHNLQGEAFPPQKIGRWMKLTPGADGESWRRVYEIARAEAG